MGGRYLWIMEPVVLEKKIILFADDDPDDRFLYETAFRELDGADRFELQFAVDGADLMAKIQSDAPLPALVFLDLNMPQLDGKQCLARIRTMAPPAELPVVILSTSGAAQDVEDAYALQANLYLQKPTTYQSIIEVLKRCIERAADDDFAVAREHFFVRAV